MLNLSFTFYIVPGNHKPIMGVVDVLRMSFVTFNLDNLERGLSMGQSKQTTKDDIFQKYDAVFSDSLGTLHGEAHQSVDKAVPPVILPARYIPVSLRPQTEKKLPTPKVTKPPQTKIHNIPPLGNNTE